MKSHKNSYCGYCHAERTGFVVHMEEAPWHLRDGSHGMDTHYLLRCAKCDCIFYLLTRTHSEAASLDFDINGRPIYYEDEVHKTYPPKPKARRPIWVPKLMGIDQRLYTVINEIYTAYEHDLFVLVAGGIRTVLDRIFDLLDIEPSKPFAQKLKALSKTDAIDQRLEDGINVLVDAGSAALHRSWAPTEEEASKLLEYLELVIGQTFFPADYKSLATLKDKVPKRSVAEK